jgi:hypothetical protein
MTICQTPDCDEHYGCRLRSKGVQIGPAATPSKPRKGTLTPTKPDKSLAKVVYDERPNGTKMPILNPDGSVVRAKQAREQPDRLRKLRQLQQAGKTG